MASKEKLYRVTGKVTISYHMSDEKQTHTGNKVVRACSEREARQRFEDHYHSQSMHVTAHANNVHHTV